MSCKPTYKGIRYNSLEELYKSVNTITSEQKYKAIQLYSDYVNNTGRKDIEGFKKFVNKNFSNNEVNQGLKIIDILQSDKAKQVFAKGEKNGWDLTKILTELGVSKQQQELIDVSKLDNKNKIAGKKLSIVAERRKLATIKDLENSQLIKNIRVDKSQSKDIKPNQADKNLASIMLYGHRYDDLSNVDYINKNLKTISNPSEMQSEAEVLAYRILNDLLFNIDELNEFYEEIKDNPEYASALTTNENPIKEFFENDIFEESDKIKLENIQSTREQIIADLLANYSYTIEINTAKEKGLKNQKKGYELEQTQNGIWVVINYRTGFNKYFATKKEAIDYINGENQEEINTQIYKDLSARNNNNISKYEGNPDWEYQELKIQVPQVNLTGEVLKHNPFNEPQTIAHARIQYNNKTKTVEVQEFQSDPFQDNKQREFKDENAAKDYAEQLKDIYNDVSIKKINDDIWKVAGRERKDLITSRNLNSSNLEGLQGQTTIREYIDAYRYSLETYDMPDATKEEIDRLVVIEEKELQSKFKPINETINSKDNKFLQLLNKNDVWITVGLKSLIQDSAKKGYEKVLFPVGDTAAKIEGHETVEEFVKNKEERLNDLNREKNKPWSVYNKTKSASYLGFKTKEDAEKYIINNNLVGWNVIKENTSDNIDNEIKQLEKEIEDAKAGRLKISAIYDFYETTIKNILDKNYGKENVNRITDEYGNGWYEIEINEKAKDKILFNKQGKNTNNLSKYFTSDNSSSQKILKQIAELGGGLGTIAKKLLENQLDIPIKLIDVPHFSNETMPKELKDLGIVLKDGFSAAAFYNPSNRTIYVAKNVKFKDSTESTLVHEILHAYTSHYVYSNPNTASVKKLQELVDYLNQPKIKELLRDTYPITNIDELLVGIFTNKKFIEDLKMLPAKNRNFKSVWDEILQVFKVIFGISDKTLFDEVFSSAATVLDESMQQMKSFEDALDVDYILADEAADNTGKQKLISNKLDELQAKVNRNPVDNSVIISGKEEIEWIRPSSEAKGDIQKRSFGLISERQEEFNKLSQEVGTLVHAIQADIIKKNFPEFNKYVPTMEVPENLQEFYASLEKELQPIIDNAKKKGSILKAEVFVGNIRTKKGGTIDLLEITREGNFIIFDTKTRYSEDKTAKRRLNKLIEWTKQTAIYGEILKTGDPELGVVSGKIEGAYILEFEFEKLGEFLNIKFKPTSNGTTASKFLSRRNAKLKITAPLFLRTKNEKLNKNIEFLLRQIDQLSKQKGGTEEQKSQRNKLLQGKLNLLQSLQIKADTEDLIEKAYEDLGDIKTMLSKGVLTDSRFIEEQLSFYSSLKSQIEDIDVNKIQKIKQIMIEAQELMDEYHKLLENIAKSSVKNTQIQDVLDRRGINLNDPIQDSGKMFSMLMTTSSIDDPYIASAVAETNLALSKSRTRLKELFSIIQKKTIAYQKATGLTTYDNMIEDGKLVGEYTKEFWKSYNNAKLAKDFDWAKENLIFDKEKYQEARNRQLNFYEAYRENYRNQLKFKNPEITEIELNKLTEKYIALEMSNWEEANNNSFTYFKAKQKWTNPKYNEIMKGPKEVKELFETFKSLIDYANQIMPDKVKKNFIPSFQKNYIEKLASMNLMSAIPDFMSGLLDSVAMDYDDELFGKRSALTGEKIGELYVPGTGNVADKSLDLPVVFFKFMEGIYRYQELSAIEETVLALKHMVKTRNYLKVDRLGRVIPDSKAPAAPNPAANNLKTFEAYIDSTFYGIKSKDDVGFEVTGNGFTEVLGILKKGDSRKISVAKIVDKLIKYTSIRNLGYNIYSPFVNLGGGTANYYMTGFNGLYYSEKDFTKAMGLALLGKTPNNETGEKVKLIMEWLEADTGEFVKEEQNKLTTAKGLQLIEEFGPMSLMRESENVMRNAGAIAMILSGKHQFKWDDFKVVDGKLEVNTDIMTKEKFRQKVIKINNKNLGGINPDDMMMMKQYIVGRMLMQHRSWLPALFFERFGRKRFDYILEQDIEGRYLTAFRLFKYYFNRSKFKELNEFEKANMKSAAAEMAMLIGTGLLLALLKAGLDDEDEKEVWAKFTKKVSSRVFSELLFFVDPTFESQYAILLNPAPVLGTSGDFGKFVGSLFNDKEEDKRKKGPVERGIKLIPGVNKVTTFLEDLNVIDFDDKK